MLAKDQCITGLDSHDIRLEVRKANPASLDAAVQTTLQLQAIFNADLANNAPQVQPPSCAVQAPNKLEIVLDQLSARLERLEMRLDGSSQARGPQPDARRRCYTRDITYHENRDCPHR